MRPAIVVVLALAALAVPTGAAAAGQPTVKVAPSRFGKIVTDGRGYTLYLFTKERTTRSECYGACAKAWPPFLVRGPLTAGAGARRSLLATTRRHDGSRQATYRGHPLYYYAGEKHAGEIFCQNVNEFYGDWLIVNPDGSPNRSPH
jgi:predicted lipoprotein with Yx(FWY)xxD motif